MTWFLAVDNWSNSITSPVPGHACQPADACEPVGAESHAWVCYGLEVQITVHMCIPSIQFSRSVVSDSLWPHGLQLARPPCPSPTPGVYSDSYPLSRWCHPTISSSVNFKHLEGYPVGSDGKESACNVRELGSIPKLGRSPGEGKGNPPHYSCLENSTDRGAWRPTVHGVAKSQTRLSDFTSVHFRVILGWIWPLNQ